MSSIRELRKKIRTIGQIRQITQAMKMVAAARLHHAQTAVVQARPFATKIGTLLGNLARTSAGDLSEALAKYMRADGKDYAILFVSSDKGFCGAYNNNLFQALESCVRENGKPAMIFSVGRKAKDYLARRKLPVEKSLANVMNKISFPLAEFLSREIIAKFEEGRFSRLICIYSEFKSLIQQKPALFEMLPLATPGQEKSGDFNPVLFEPSKERILESLVPRHISAQIFRILLEAYASELASRVNAMEQASKNGKEMIEKLTLHMNKVRQAMITTQILDIVGTGEAIE